MPDSRIIACNSFALRPETFDPSYRPMKRNSSILNGGYATAVKPAPSQTPNSQLPGAASAIGPV